MNPLNFKAHPYLTQWITLLTEPSSFGFGKAMHLLAILLASNLLRSEGLPCLMRKLENLELSPFKAYRLSLPAPIMYGPLMLTLLDDILARAFVFSSRWFLLFAIPVSSQLLTAFYAFALRHPRNNIPIGLESGLVVSLFLLLVSIPASVILMGINAVKPIF